MLLSRAGTVDTDFIACCPFPSKSVMSPDRQIQKRHPLPNRPVLAPRYRTPKTRYQLTKKTRYHSTLPLRVCVGVVACNFEIDDRFCMTSWYEGISSRNSQVGGHRTSTSPSFSGGPVSTQPIVMLLPVFFSLFTKRGSRLKHRVGRDGVPSHLESGAIGSRSRIFPSNNMLLSTGARQ